MSRVVQGLHGVREEILGKAASPVLGMGEELCYEGGSGSPLPECPVLVRGSQDQSAEQEWQGQAIPGEAKP